MLSEIPMASKVQTSSHDFNGYGYFYVRMWNGFGLPANSVEEDMLLSILLHAFAGIVLLALMTVHMLQFRLGTLRTSFSDYHHT